MMLNDIIEITEQTWILYLSVKCTFILLIIKYASNFNIKNAISLIIIIFMSLGCKFTNMNNLLIKAVLVSYYVLVKLFSK